jgi:uncharacterized protein
MRIKLLLSGMILILFYGCGNNLTPEEEKYINNINSFRQEKDDYMMKDSSSPFNQDKKAVYKKLNYYDIDMNFVFRSKLYPYENKDTVTVLGTKGEERKVIKFGYVEFDYKNNRYKLNVYRGQSKSGIEYYSIWFTDKTTGEETYGVGRYIDFEYVPDPGNIYTIDFNLAYNPYCAYSSQYSCAIPTKEDHIDLAVEAGEKNFH